MVSGLLKHNEKVQKGVQDHLNNLVHSVTRLDQEIERMMFIMETKPKTRFDERTSQNKVFIPRPRELESGAKIGLPAT